MVAVIGTLVAAIATLWQNSETFRQAITTSWNKFKDDVTKAFSQITSGLNELGINWETIFNALKAVWDGFCQALAPVFTTVWSTILEVFSTVIETLSNVFSIFANAFQGDWQGVWNSVLKLFYDIGSGIWNVAKSIFDGISQVWNNFIGPFQSAWEKAWNGISSFFTNLMNAILDGFSKVVNWVLDAVGTLAGGVGAFLDFLGIEAGTKLMEWADKVKDTEVDVAVATAGFIDRVGTTIETGMSEANDFFTKGWDEIVGNVETTDISDAVEDSMDGVVAVIEGKSEEAAQAAGEELAKVPRVVAEAVGASSAEVESMLDDYSVEGLDILTTLASQLAMVDDSQAALGEEFDATAAKMAAYQQAIQALNDLGFSESSELIITLQATLEGLGITLDDTAEDAETNQQKILNAFEQSVASINANADAMGKLGREYDKDGELVKVYQSTLNDLLSLPVEERFEGWLEAVSELSSIVDSNAEQVQSSQDKILNTLNQNVSVINANAEALSQLGEEYDREDELIQIYQKALNDLLSIPVDQRLEGWSAAVSDISNAIESLTVEVEEMPVQQQLIDSFNDSKAVIEANAESLSQLGIEYDSTGKLIDAARIALNGLLDLPVEDRYDGWEESVQELTAIIELGAKEVESSQTEIMNSFNQGILAIDANARALEDLGISYDKSGELVDLYQSTLDSLLALPVDQRFEGWTSSVEMMSNALDELNKKSENENFLDKLNKKNEEWYNDTGRYISQVESMYSQMSGYVMDITGAVFDYINQGYENQINALQEQIDTNNEMYERQIRDEEDRYNRELANLKELYANKEISDEEYRDQKNALEQQMTDFVKRKNDEKAASEAELKKQQNELARKQFESNKATQIAEVWINAAAATMRAFAENWWPIALGIAAAIAAIAGVQTAAIAKQQFVPMYAKGGIVDKPTLGIFGEAGKEAIVPLERNTEWMDILEDRMMKAIGGAANAGYNIVFNSPKAIDAREASRLMKRTVRDLAEGF